jgi:hypothetical protein
VLPQWPPLCKLEQAAGEVGAQVVEVGVHGVGAPAEVDVVGEVEALLLGKLAAGGKG